MLPLLGEPEAAPADHQLRRDDHGDRLEHVGDAAGRQGQRRQEHEQQHRHREAALAEGGVEGAEGLAELWHKRVRRELDIAQDDSTDIRGLFAQHYQGSRYSFGYPACPRLEDQVHVCKLLRPERIGVTLTEEGFQLVPEQSTSAIVAHHPEAGYFSI